MTEFHEGQRVKYLGHDKTVMRVSTVEPAVLCSHGYPSKRSASTNWYYSDELEIVDDNEPVEDDVIDPDDWTPLSFPYVEREDDPF